MHYIPGSYRFIVKLYRRSAGAFTIFLAAGLFFIVFGLAMFTFERSVPGSAFNVWNSQWLTAVTQCTIGYGDMTPKTHLGRITICLTAFIGITITSFVVRTFRIQCRANGAEIQLMAAIREKAVFRRQFKELAAVLIQRRWVLHRKRLLREPRFFYMLKYTGWLLRFRRLRLAYQLANQSDIFFETSIDAFQSKLTTYSEQIPPQASTAKNCLSLSSNLLTHSYSTLSKLQSSVRLYSHFAGKDIMTLQLPRSHRGSTSRRSRQNSVKIQMKQASEAGLRRLMIRHSVSSSERS